MALLACVTTTSIGCATSSGSSTRELPVGLASLGSLLDGCPADASDDGVVRMRCGGDVVLAVKSKPAGTGEATYKNEAYAIAQNAGARLVWDTVIVPTEAESGLVDRARALEPGSDVVKGVLVGVVRPIDAKSAQEIWCTSVDTSGNSRCEALVGAMLGASLHPSTNASANASTTPTSTNTSTNASTSTSTNASTSAASAANVFGHSISLPSTCAVTTRDDGGDVTCKDGAKISWRRFDAMDDATQAVSATMAAVGEDNEGATFACTIAGEVGRCEAHAHASAGVTYLDGKPLVAFCVLEKEDPKKSALCQSIMTPKK